VLFGLPLETSPAYRDMLYAAYPTLHQQ